MRKMGRVTVGAAILLLLVGVPAWSSGQPEEPDDRGLLEQKMESEGVVVRIDDDAWDAGIRAGFRAVEAELDDDNRTKRDSYAFIVTADGLGERTGLIKPFPIANVDVFYTPEEYQDARTLRDIPEEARRPLGESGIAGPYARVTITAEAIAAAQNESDSLDEEIAKRGTKPDNATYFELAKGALFSETAAAQLGFIGEIDRVGDETSFNVYKWRVDDLMLFGNK